MGFERRLDRGAAHAGLNARGAAGDVHFEHAVEMPHVEADSAGEAVADDRLDAADHRRAAPNGMTATFAPPAQSNTAAMSASASGSATKSGALAKSRAKARTVSGKDLP